MSDGAVWRGRLLALAGIILVALNLRTAVVALSPIVANISVDIPLSSLVLGVLGMLPPLTFAVFGILTPLLARRFGLEVTVLIAVSALILGAAGRGLAPDVVTLTVLSVLAFAGIGIGNVVLPPLVKKYFPDRIGVVTAGYATMMAVSTFIPPLLAVAVADAVGWRLSLAEWALPAVIAFIPWLVLLLHPRRTATRPLPEEPDAVMLGRVWRSPLAWALVALFVGSGGIAYSMFAWLPQILADIAGATPIQAGALLAVFAAVGVPISIIVPIMAVKRGAVLVLILSAALATVLGYLGLLLAPAELTWLWVALVGAGTLLFPLTLVLINLRTRGHVASVALSGFVQGAGYVIAALVPFGIGLLHESTGSWSVPLVALLILGVVGCGLGLVAARDRMLEDTLR